MGSACFHYVASSISVFFQKPLILKSLILLTLFNSFWWTLALFGIEGNFCITMASLRSLYFSVIESNIMALIFLLVFKAQSFPCLMALIYLNLWAIDDLLDTKEGSWIFIWIWEMVGPSVCHNVQHCKADYVACREALNPRDCSLPVMSALCASYLDALLP